MLERESACKRTNDELKKCIDFQSKTLKKFFKMIKEKNNIIAKNEREIINLKFKIKKLERKIKILEEKNDFTRS